MRPALILFLATLCSSAQARTWKNADASASFEGEYLSHTPQDVTIRRADGKEFTLSRAKLHEDDIAWLTEKDAPPPPPDDAVFDTLRFGEDRKQVEAKLLESRVVEPVVDPTFLGRLGLNGSFRTRQKIGDLHCLLFFTWGPADKLSEVILQTEACGDDAYPVKLKSTWQELITLLSQLHGKPVQNTPYPRLSDLPDGGFLGTHLWHLKHGGSALLGTARQGSGYQTAVRFTAETVQPIRTP